ncbi:ABC transporter substrate-binding protein [Sphingomonas xinjiangensis]|uniref:Peptide/nickel transport system substrate-binding protein n=1 Tax=Sphingomonas xinjiangensis TaxID=643568 RepID=A0A840YQ76_9SPHN|nr:peptide/nickel transport system substrate-binding protein [Sphingomonas xinjiangensis]
MVASAIGGAATIADPSASKLDFAQRVLVGATAQGLVRFDSAGGIEPGLAERWIVIDDGRSYIFRLREAHWGDGTEVTAGQVVRSIRRSAAERSRNALAPYLAVIDQVVEMTPQIIEVRLKQPRPDLLKLFAQPELAVLRPRGRDGSGPFRAQPSGGGVLLHAVDQTYASEDASTPASRSLRLFGERAAVAIARFRAGQSDLILGGRFTDWPIATSVGLNPANLRIDPAQGLFGLAVVRREGFLADAGNRAAVSMAIDRARLTQALMPNWTPSETLLPAQLDSAVPPALSTWSIMTQGDRRAAARARVALWRRTHPGPMEVRIALPTGPGATLLWGHLAEAMLRIGLTPVRVAIDAPAELRLLDEVAPYDSGRWYVNTACVACSPEAAALIAAGREAPSLTERAQRIAEADAALTRDAAFIPLAQPLRWSAVALRLDAWQRNTRAWHPLNHLRNDRE